MPFSSFTSVGEVASKYQITLHVEDFLRIKPVPVTERFRRDLDFVLAKIAYRASEFAICENLVYPILKEAWVPYADEMQLWCHAPLAFDKDLAGTPDYFVTRRSPLGTLVMENPLLMVMEAKKDDFEWGWAQCLAAMVAAQKLNNSPTLVIHGITTTGGAWQFGKLEGSSFTCAPGPIGLANIEDVLAAITFLFEQCRQQLAAYAGAA